MNEMVDMRDVRDRLIWAALPHVPFDGWSRRTLREAAKDVGFDQTMGERAFPGGALSAVEHFAELADRRLASEIDAAELEGLRRSERIAWLIKKRIEPWGDSREAIRRAVTLLSLPGNNLAALQVSWRTVDKLWYAAGDTSADFSYYTKRVTLAAVYTSTLLYWLEDDSEGAVDTWAFMRRRLADAMKLTRLRAHTRIAGLPNPFALFYGKSGGKRRFGVRSAG